MDNSPKTFAIFAAGAISLLGVAYVNYIVNPKSLEMLFSQLLGFSFIFNPLLPTTFTAMVFTAAVLDGVAAGIRMALTARGIL